MKITVKNYRTIKNSEINLTENQINYFIGSNESGKTNVLDAIRVIGKITNTSNKKSFIKLKNDDATIKKSIPGKVEDIEFYIESGGIINLIDSNTRESKWLSKDFPIYEKYKKLINIKKSKGN